MQNSCIPAIKNIMQTKDGYPATGSPNTSVFAIITIIINKDIRQKINPIIEEMASGIVENAIIPSRE